MARFIVEIDDSIIKDIRSIYENEVGIDIPEDEMLLHAVIKEGCDSIDYQNPHLEDITIQDLDKKET